MKQEIFKTRYGERWRQFETILRNLEARKKKGAREFPFLYRRICHDLNTAQANNYDSKTVEYLNRLATRGHQLLYKLPLFSLKQITSFFIHDFPNAVRKEFRLVLFSLILFYGSVFGIFFYIQQNPEFIYSIVDEHTIRQMESVYNPDSDIFLKHRGNESDLEMFGFYIRNNISIDFMTFAGGAFLGLGSLAILLVNGILIGAIASHIVNIGYSGTFFPFIVGHSSLELTALVLIAVAGFRLGWSFIVPGRLTRTQAFKAAAYRAIPIVYGSATMTFLAAIIEAFWSSYPMATTVKYIAGTALWILMILYFIFSGRRYGS